MTGSKVPFNITYRKTGTSPPIYIAGSFSDPEWQLQEMDHSIDGDGEHTFKAQLMVEPEKEYQFKLRIGEGDWWILTDNYPTATDASGNQNNLLIAPRPSANAKVRETDKGKGKAVDVAEMRPSGTSSKPEIVVETNDDNMGDAENLKTPLFAHECFGAYEFADISDHELDEGEISRRQSRPKSKDLDTEFDVNDPTIEAFPSDRTSILDALRTIQTHLSEDKTHLDDIPTSPRVVSARRTSTDYIDETSLSPAILSPTTSRKRDSRLSHSSGRNRSAASLGSIAEEPKPAPQGAQKPPRVSPPNAKTKSLAPDLKAPQSEEDEGVVMTTSEY